MFTKNAKRREKLQPVAVPLDMLPERRTINPEISARGSLTPAGDGFKLPPGQGSEGGKSRPPDHMRQIPFLTAAQFHLTTLTKISTDIYLRM